MQLCTSSRQCVSRINNMAPEQLNKRRVELLQVARGAGCASAYPHPKVGSLFQYALPCVLVQGTGSVLVRPAITK